MKAGTMHKNTIENIKKWDEKLTLKENAKKLGIRNNSARHFVLNYNLKYKKVVPTYDWSKWNPNLTIKENAKVIGCPVGTATHKSLTHKLKYKPSQRGLSCDVEKKALAITLKEKGYTYEAIGKLFGGISRQAVEQLIKYRVKKVVGR